MAAKLTACGEAVRQGDPDRFLCTLFAPAGARPDLFALYAFNIEVAKVREVVTEPTLGEIRLQWWREALGEAYAGKPRRHPVVEALSEAIARHALDRGLLDRILDARSFDLRDELPADIKVLEWYAEATSGSLVELAAQVLGVRGEVIATAARHVGIAFALSGLLRAVPFHARQGRVYLPANVLAAQGIGAHEVTRGTPSTAISQTAGVVAELAHAHVLAARRLRGPALRPAQAALLPAALAAMDLARLGHAGYDPFEVQAAWTPLVRRLALTVIAARGRY